MKQYKNAFGVIGLIIAIGIIAYVVYVYMGKQDSSSSATSTQGAIASMDKAQSTIDAVNKISQDRYNSIQ